MDTSSTQNLINEVTAYLTTLNVTVSDPCERWEGDGVWVVGPECEDPDAPHWYLYVAGSDTWDEEPGISLVHITMDRATGDTCDTVTSFEELGSRLRTLGFVS